MLSLKVHAASVSAPEPVLRRPPPSAAALLLLNSLPIETHAAQDWSLFARHKGNDRGGATCRAHHLSLHTRTHICAFRLAGLATLGVILELFLTKEDLLADAENEWLSTVNAGQGLVTVFHATHFLATAQSVRCTSRTPGRVGSISGDS